MKYQEIAKDMASKINNGFYTDRLPSEADLMENMPPVAIRSKMRLMLCTIRASSSAFKAADVSSIVRCTVEKM